MMKSLVVYYSWSNCTRIVANFIKDLTNADIIELQPSNPYPKDYDQTCRRAKKELTRKELVPISNSIPDLSQYSTVFIGSPCWSSHIAGPVRTFLLQNDLSGKTIAVFNTNLGSGLADMESDVKELCRNSKFIKRGLEMWGSSVQNNKKKVQSWLESNGLLQ